MRIYGNLIKADNSIELEETALKEAKDFYAEPNLIFEVDRTYSSGIYGDGRFGAPMTVRIFDDETDRDRYHKLYCTEYDVV